MEDITEKGKYYLATEESFIPGLIYDLYNFIEKRFDVQPAFDLKDKYLCLPVILNQLGSTCRVKVLDDDDIFDCGWKKHWDVGTFKLGDSRLLIGSIGGNRMYQMINPNIICESVFWGEIPNKGELLFQMKRLGISK